MTHPSGEAIEAMLRRIGALEQECSRTDRENRRLRHRLAVVCAFAERQMRQQDFFPHGSVWSRKHLEGK